MKKIIVLPMRLVGPWILALLVHVASLGAQQRTVRSERCLPITKEGSRICRVDTLRVTLHDTVTQTSRDTVVRVDTVWRDRIAPPQVVKVKGSSCWDSWVCPTLAAVGTAGAVVLGVQCARFWCKNEQHQTTNVSIFATSDRSPRGRSFGFGVSMPFMRPSRP